MFFLCTTISEDKSLYPASGEAFGAVKILDDAMPVVSEKNADELSPWAHSSLRGKAFVARTVAGDLPEMTW